MFPPFPEEKAFEVCLEMKRALKDGSLSICHDGSLSCEREGQGVMVGALLCHDDLENVHTLLAVSGATRTLVSRDDLPPFTVAVPSVVENSRITEALLPNDKAIHLLTEKVNALKKSSQNDSRSNEAEIAKYMRERSSLTLESQNRVFDLYSFHCADGRVRSLREICRSRNIKMPPTGTGECCAPKLLDYAYAHSLKPFSMAELFVQNSEDCEERPRPPCEERCRIILPEMLGLEILYRDSQIAVINKQSGLLSIPGRTPDKKDCVTSRLKNLFPECIEQPSCHRLDMETSGLMVLAFTKEAHRNLSIQFENGNIGKEYEACLDGILSQKGISAHGTMELYFRLDIENRPHQIWDAVYGKKSVTEWEIIRVEKYTAPDSSRRDVTRVRFIPRTGRTHQLRLASADSHGFGVPIVGDSLYGKCGKGERLLLHASRLSFDHPGSGKRMEFESASPF
ncbi:MAG: RluA family pseudouridine synthase [Treponema sp.]|nr:RluA family pseudouridine synthase [Treponema sp.]